MIDKSFTLTKLPQENTLKSNLNSVLEEPLKSFRQGMEDMKKAKIQLVIKHIQEYMNQIESFSRFVVVFSK